MARILRRLIHHHEDDLGFLFGWSDIDVEHGERRERKLCRWAGSTGQFPDIGHPQAEHLRKRSANARSDVTSRTCRLPAHVERAIPAAPAS